MPDQLVHLKGGRVATETDLLRLLDLEARGVHFRLADDGRVRVSPSDLLSDTDKVFLRQHHDLVVYCLTVTYTDGPDGATL
jgi:hypothetical protein